MGRRSDHAPEQLRELREDFSVYVNQQDAATRRELLNRSVRHNFSIREFGLYNCARPVQPALISLQARYVDTALRGTPPLNQTETENVLHERRACVIHFEWVRHAAPEA